MDFILCSVAFVTCLAVQVGSQLPDKPIGEWHPDRFEMYPNPWVNFTKCKTQKPSGLCDYNGMLTEEQRNYFTEQPEMQEISDADRLCLCNISCGSEIRFMVTVTVMRKIGPQITNYRAAAKEFVEKFRAHWSLDDCSVILIASKNDNMSFLEAGPDVIKVLSANETERIDQHIYEKYFMQGHFVDGINETLVEYRNAQTSAPKPESEAHAIVGVTVVVLIVVITLSV